MTLKTYSFQDVKCTFTHDSIASKTTTGQGVGSISVTMANDLTNHELAADGKVQISRICSSNGTISVSILQSSELHAILLKWYNYIILKENLSEWSTMTIRIESDVLKDTIECSGVSPQKAPDISFESQAKQITWNFMAEEITHVRTESTSTM